MYTVQNTFLSQHLAVVFTKHIVIISGNFTSKVHFFLWLPFFPVSHLASISFHILRKYLQNSSTISCRLAEVYEKTVFVHGLKGKNEIESLSDSMKCRVLKNMEWQLKTFSSLTFRSEWLILKYFCLEYSDKSLPVGNTYHFKYKNFKTFKYNTELVNYGRQWNFCNFIVLVYKFCILFRSTTL